jgi:hypothetical protein
MISIQPQQHRGKDIIALLLEHGPLSYSALSRMLMPPMKRKRLKESLLCLKRKGFINANLIADTKTFYRFSQKLKNRERLGQYLNRPESDFFQPTFRSRDFVHSESVEYWIFILKRIFPDAEFVREAYFGKHDVAVKTLLISSDERELRPDFLIVFKKEDSTERAVIAVEVEKTRKSDLRIINKLSKYANESFLDGVIYICDDDRLHETIRLLFVKKVLEKSHRIKQYGKNFILFSDATKPFDQSKLSLVNSVNDKADVDMWIRKLRNKKPNFRRDEEFEMPGPLALPVVCEGNQTQNLSNLN